MHAIQKYIYIIEFGKLLQKEIFHSVVLFSDFIYEKFGKTDDNTKLFRSVVRSKCNNAKKKVISISSIQ